MKIPKTKTQTSTHNKNQLLSTQKHRYLHNIHITHIILNHKFTNLSNKTSLLNSNFNRYNKSIHSSPNPNFNNNWTSFNSRNFNSQYNRVLFNNNFLDNNLIFLKDKIWWPNNNKQYNPFKMQFKFNLKKSDFQMSKNLKWLSLMIMMRMRNIIQIRNLMTMKNNMKMKANLILKNTLMMQKFKKKRNSMILTSTLKNT